MRYIQLDNFNGNLNIICEDNGSGEPLIFDSLKEAENTLNENCQNGQVIPLDINIIQLLRNCEEFVSSSADEGFYDKQLCEELHEVLQSR